jgi:hypothetical protein
MVYVLYVVLIQDKEITRMKKFLRCLDFSLTVIATGMFVLELYKLYKEHKDEDGETDSVAAWVIKNGQELSSKGNMKNYLVTTKITSIWSVGKIGEVTIMKYGTECGLYGFIYMNGDKATHKVGDMVDIKVTLWDDKEVTCKIVPDDVDLIIDDFEI